jgi:hypothetical protein
LFFFGRDDDVAIQLEPVGLGHIQHNDVAIVENCGIMDRLRSCRGRWDNF